MSARHERPTTSAWIPQAAALAVLVAVGVLISSGIRTSRAEVSASTSTNGFLASATVSIDQVGVETELLFNTDLLYPGEASDACVEVEYTGSVPAELRLHGRRIGGSGLDAYVDLSLWTTSAPCPARPGNRLPIYEGLLAQVWAGHGNYDTGIPLDTTMLPGDRLTLMARAELNDAQAAQGRETEFVIVLEARP